MLPNTPIKSDVSFRFSPHAWAQLQYLRDLGPTEVSVFGISHDEDLLLVRDLFMVKQECSSVTTEMDDEELAKKISELCEEGLHPRNVSRIWIHTHPGSSPNPSGTDENTFATRFGHNDWAVMYILARGGQTYCRLRVVVDGTAITYTLPTRIDYSTPFKGTNFEEWKERYDECVTEEIYSYSYGTYQNNYGRRRGSGNYGKKNTGNFKSPYEDNWRSRSIHSHQRTLDWDEADTEFRGGAREGVFATRSGNITRLTALGGKDEDPITPSQLESIRKELDEEASADPTIAGIQKRARKNIRGFPTAKDLDEELADLFFP